MLTINGPILWLLDILKRRIAKKYNLSPAHSNRSHPRLRGRFTTVLGERLNGIQEVSGSIPLISTKCTDRCKKTVAIERLQRFFFWLVQSCDFALARVERLIFQKYLTNQGVLKMAKIKMKNSSPPLWRRCGCSARGMEQSRNTAARWTKAVGRR